MRETVGKFDASAEASAHGRRHAFVHYTVRSMTASRSRGVQDLLCPLCDGEIHEFTSG